MVEIGDCKSISGGCLWGMAADTFIKFKYKLLSQIIIPS